MFKHFLLPTDGSAIAAKAVKAGVALAKETGAYVTGYYAIESVPQLYYGDGYVFDRKTIADFERRARDAGRKYLAKIKQESDAAGVTCKLIMTITPAPYIGIVDAAKKHKCDVIFMASHGRSGISRLIMGSVVQKVLTHSKVPVLVYR